MGFTPKRRVYVLDFTGDDELDGLEVSARSAPIGMMMDMAGMVDAMQDYVGQDETVLAGLDEPAQLRMVRAALSPMRAMVERFGEVLVSWNYEDEQGREVPATEQGLLTLDPAHLMRIIRAWQRAVSEAPDAVGKASSGGSPSPEASLPMDVSSPSLAS